MTELPNEAPELTILKAAANILRLAGIERAQSARTLKERECANAALQASVGIDDYLRRLDDLERPF